MLPCEEDVSSAWAAVDVMEKEETLASSTARPAEALRYFERLRFLFNPVMWLRV